MNTWSLPYVTGKKYKVHWQHGLDFTDMQMTLSERWSPSDSEIYFVFNFTDVRAEVKFTTAGKVTPNDTIRTDSNEPRESGINMVYNQTDVREIHTIVNGKNPNKLNIFMKGSRCIGACIPSIVKVPIEDRVRLWSDPTSWASGAVPLAGEDIVIPPGQNFVFDLVESPIYNYIQINGRVTFKPDAPALHLKAKYVFVRAGELIIGTSAARFAGNAQITLFGEKENA